MKKLIAILGVVIASAFTTQAALATGNNGGENPWHPDPHPTDPHCLNGSTTTLPTAVAFSGGYAILTESAAGNFIKSTGGAFYAGRLKTSGNPAVVVPSAVGLLQPGSTPNRVSKGACTAAPGEPYVAPDARRGVCKAGVFYDVLQSQAVAADGEYSVLAGKATYAYFSSHGLTCDNPTAKYGDVCTSTLVDGDGRVNADSDDAPGQEVWRANVYPVCYAKPQPQV